MASNDPHTEEGLDRAESALGTRPRAGGAAPDDWDMHLAPLIHAVPPVAPPGGLFARIVHRIATADARAAVARAQRSARRARSAAAALFAVATMLTLFLVVEPAREPVPPAPRYMAVVTAEGSGQALVVTIDTASGQATVEPVGITAPEGRVLQLWTIEGSAAPRPVGVLEAAPLRLTLETVPGATLAVSDEPPGGSPTGLPTGTVLFTGPVVAVAPGAVPPSP